MTKPKLEHYKLLAETADHYHLQHPDKSNFKIAKKGLSKEMHDKVQKMCSGGAAYAEGGKVPPTSPFPAQDSPRKQVADAQGPRGELPPIQRLSGQDGSVVQPADAATAVLSDAPSAPVEDTPTPDLSTTTTPDVTTNPTPAATPEEAAEETQQLNNKPDTSFMAGINKALDAQEANTARKGDIEGKLALKLAPTYKEAGANLDSIAKGLLKSQKKHQTDMDELKQSIIDGKIDPDRYWKNIDANPGKRVSTLLGMFLGGLGTGYGLPNQALNTVNSSIDADIAAQKADQGNRLSLYNMIRDQSNSDAEAALKTKDIMMTSQEAKAQAIAAKMGPALNQVNAGLLNNASQERRAQDALKYQMMGLKSGMETNVLPQNDRQQVAMLGGPELMSRMVTFPNGTMAAANDKDDATKAKAAQIAHHNLSATMDALDQISPSGAFTSPEEYAKAQALSSKFILDLKSEADAGRLSPALTSMAGKLSNNPASIKTILTGTGGRQAFRKEIDSDLRNKLAQYIPAYKNPDYVKGKPRK